MARKNSLAVAIREMKIGEIREYPLDRYSTVQSTASREGLVNSRVYTTESDRERRIISIKRLK